jgi:hypothetical protein
LFSKIPVEEIIALPLNGERGVKNEKQNKHGTLRLEMKRSFQNLKIY